MNMDHTNSGIFPLLGLGHGEHTTESLDPNEIRIALDALRELMSKIRSKTIGQDLESTYERISSISITE